MFVWGYIFRLGDVLLIMYAKYDTAALQHLLFYSQKFYKQKFVQNMYIMCRKFWPPGQPPQARGH